MINIKTTKLNLVLMLTILVIINLGGVVNAVDYYVATTGSDITGDGSIGNPWGTITYAANVSVACDTVHVRGGDYNERISVKNNGTPSCYITFTNYSGEIVIINGSGRTLNGLYDGLFNVYGKSYINVTGFFITNSSAVGLEIATSGRGSDNITAGWLIFNNTNSSAVQIRGGALGYGMTTANITLHHSNITNAQNGLGALTHEIVTISEDVDYFWIHDNNISNNNATQGNAEGIDAKNGTSHGYIYNNTVSGVRNAAIYVDAYKAYTHDHHIYNNWVCNNTIGNAIGIAIASESGGLLDGVDVYNNVACDNGGDGIQIGSYSTGEVHHINITGNTVVHNGLTSPYQFGGIGVSNVSLWDISVRNNLMKNNSAYQMRIVNNSVSADHNLIYPYKGGAASGFEAKGTNYIELDPRFSDEVNHNYNLNITSPAINMGNSTNLPSSFDYNYNSRIQGISVDIGAYEYQNPSNLSISYVSPTDGNSTVNRLHSNVTASILGAGSVTAFTNWNESLAIWYRFNNESGENDTKIVDWSGNGNNGTLINMSVGIDNGSSGWNSNGRYNRTISFNGINTSVNITSSAIMNHSSVLSIEMWFKTPNTFPTSTQGGMSVLASRYDYGNNRRVWRIGLMNPFVGTYNMDRFSIVLGFPNNGTLAGRYYINQTLTNNTWYHGVAIFNNGNIKLYLNAVNSTILSLSGSVIPPSLNITSSTPLLLGADLNTVPADFFNGKVDEFKMWSGRELSSDEINSSYDAITYGLTNNNSGLSNRSYNYTSYVQDGTGTILQTAMQRVIPVFPNNFYVSSNNMFLVNVSIWRTDSDYYKYFRISGTDNIIINSDDGTPFTVFNVKVNGSSIGLFTSNNSGYIAFTSTINGDTEFEITLWSPAQTTDCTPIKSSLNAGFILVGIILIVVAAALIVMGLRSQNTLALIPGIATIVIGSALIYIGFFINATLSTVICIPPP